jgi:Icc-related predicted phosphoesterase
MGHTSFNINNKGVLSLFNCIGETFMKVLATADFHGSLEASKRTALKANNIGADAVVVCGDITHFGSPKDAEKVLSPLTALKLPVLYVPGNCDPPSLIENAECLHGKCQTIGTYSFVGAGSIPVDRVHPSPLDVSEEEILEALTQGLKQCQSQRSIIVVAHSPPLYTKLDLAYFGGHVGSSSLRRFIEQTRPTVVFCGHIHEARGIDYIGETLIANTGAARHGYYVVADFNGKVEVELSHL